jgi:hypothetical protein
VITSFKADGYHRVPLERSKKGNVVEQVAGSNLQLVKNRWQAGVSFIYSKFDRQYQPAFQEYNRFYLRGNSNWNGSIDYTYRFRKFSFVGESAMSQNGSMATLNTLNFYPRQGVALTVLQRQYSRSYQAQYANAFSDGSNVQNESGWYVGSQFSPSGKLSISLYADAASFPWLKYGVNSPSKSFDYLVQSNYRYDPSLAVEVRYRFRQKEDNFKYPDEKTTSILEYDQHKLLVQAMKTLSHGWSTHTTLDWNAYKPEHLSPEYGWMISQLVSWQSPKRWKTDFFAGYFDADSYSVRVYSRERNIVNSFYMPSFYGKGMRLALSGKYGIRPGLSLAVKGAISNYFDRETIGSDLEKIDSRRRIDMMTYLKWSF